MKLQDSDKTNSEPSSWAVQMTQASVLSSGLDFKHLISV